MSGFGTDFTETEALLYAQTDRRVGSGNNDQTDGYLGENFTAAELVQLKRDALHLALRCDEVARRLIAESDAADAASDPA